MRQVFSSPRLENVEQVAQLLRDAGIEVRITHGRSYKSPLRGDFSYSDHDSPRPAVWVVQSAQQVPARAILREAGLIDSTRGDSAYTLPVFRSTTPVAASDPVRRRAFKLKMGLLAIIGVVLALGLVQMLDRPPPAAPSSALPAAQTVLATPPFDGSTAATLAPVARAVFASEIAEIDTPVACLAVDGHDAPAALVGSLHSPTHSVVAASDCVRVADEDLGSFQRGSQREATLLEVTAFRPSAPDAGTVEFSAYHHRMWASYKTLEVRRVDGAWQVVRVIKHVRT